MAFPKRLKVFTAEFGDVGQSTEFLLVRWNYPAGNPGARSFLVGTDIFLETITGISQVPDEALIASISMMAILAGALPGTQEFFDAVTVQDTKNFQTIVGDAKLKQAPDLVDDLTIGPPGTVYDLTFQKVGSAPTKVVRADAWSISQYSNRESSPAHSVDCVPGAVHKQFAFKKSQLGSEGSANRQSVIDYIAGMSFWI